MDPRDPPTPQHQLIPVPVINHAGNSHKTSTGMNILTILLLLFIYPIGVFVMWFGTKWSLIIKLLITGLGVVLFAVFAILTVIGLTVFTGLQRGERDKIRRIDIEAISMAMEYHYDVQSGNYSPLQPDWFKAGKIPQDPMGENYQGFLIAPASQYKICATLENSTSSGESNQFCRESAR